MTFLTHETNTARIDPRSAGGELSIDLDALKANYLALARASHPARVAGVVKANAYGLGIDVIVPALLSTGCSTFFVATPEEGLMVRRYAASPRIFVLSGLVDADVASLYADAELIPVLNCERDATVWQSHCSAIGRCAPCAVHVDTGMNRLGFTPAGARAFAERNSRTNEFNVVLLMSHLACADQPEHPLNIKQVESFREVRAAFGDVEASLANSAGIFLGPTVCQDLTRPGIALYIGLPDPSGKPVAAPVVTLSARIIQVRQALAGEGVSYGSAILMRDSILAVAAVGYGDGFPRSLSGTGIPLRELGLAGGGGFLHGRHVPIIGRVTMDLTIFDVTDLGPDAVQLNDRIELIGPNMPIDRVAAAAGTIPYEILTGLGSRYHRRTFGSV